MSLKISIIIPVYNVDRYLEECLNSILHQTYTNYEVIMVDDGSTDGSSLICDEFAQKDARFKVIHQFNQGAAIAKNVGLDAATGQLVAFVDSDDTVESNWLDKVVALMNETGADIVEYAFDKIYLNTKEMVVFPQESLGTFSAELYLEQYCNVWQSSLFCTKVFRAQLLQNIRFRKERRCIDDEFFTYKVVSRAKKIVRINDILYHYRQRASSAVYNQYNNIQKAEDAVEILKERYLWIKKFFPTLTKKFLRHDVDMLVVFSQNFAFSGKGVKLFKKTARYYLKECMIRWTDKVTFIYTLRCVFSRKKCLEMKKKKQQALDENYQYFE